MMTLKDALDAYQSYTAKASEVSRQLAMAGMAVVWMFRSVPKQNAEPSIEPAILRWAAIAFTGALIFDFLHYVVASLVWGAFHRSREKVYSKNMAEDREFLAPRWINYPALIFFWLKVALVAVGYATFFKFVIQ